MDFIELGRKIYETAHITGEFTLRSGRKSNEYFDKYLIETNPKLLKPVAESIIHLLPAQYDYIAGLELGGVPIATTISLLTGKPQLFIRKKPKEYGTRRAIEGSYDLFDKIVVIIEDVVTSGGAIIEAVKLLRREGSIVNKAFCVIRRSNTGYEHLSDLHVKLTHLYTHNTLNIINNGIEAYIENKD